MGKKLGLFLACLFATSMAFAQKLVTGTVVDEETGEPLPGATVKVKNSDQGVLTDMDGKFTFKHLPANAKTLVVSFMGMETKEVSVKGGNIHVSLVSNDKILDEVMVVAYGTATKAKFTGSAAVVDNSKIEAIASTNALDAITGNVAGVEVYNATGDPTNASPAMRIRGISSISAGTSPLIVVDGTPYGGDMNSINTNDIESMTVLKDAAANALYGSRAANGVIMITTKKGKQGGAKVNLDASWGSNSRAQRQYKTIKNPAQYIETYANALNNYAQNALGMTPEAANVWINQNITTNGGYGLGTNIYNLPAGQSLIGTNGRLNPNAQLGYVTNYNGQDFLLTPDNWMDETYFTSLRQDYNLTVSNATENSNFYANFNYLNNKGITKNSGYETLGGRLKAEIQAKPWLKVGANMTFAHYNGQRVSSDGSSNSSDNPFAVATQVAPIYPMYIRDGQGRIMVDANGFQMYDWGDGKNAGYIRPYLPGSNAVQAAILDENSFEGNSMNVNGYAEIRFLKDFKFTTSNTVNLDETRATGLINGYYGSYASSQGILSKGHSRGLAYTYQQLLTWGHVYGQHDVDVLLGHEYYRNNSYSLSASKNNQFDPNNNELSGAINDQSKAASSRGYYNTEGYFARAQYNYAQKYFLSASVRRDASSCFAKTGGRWWGNFYSAGAAWVISQEKFMENVKWINLLKLKASYGENGNDAIGSFRYTNTYIIGNSNGNPSATPGTMGNLDIKWEKNGNLNTGIEFELFKGRLNGGIEYFWRKTSDMLYWFSTPSSLGWTGYYANVGDMKNQGVEVELNADLVRTKNVKWNVGVNLTHYQNKITYMPEDKKTQEAYDFDHNLFRGYASGNNFLSEGLDRYTYYTHMYAGVYNKNTYMNTFTQAEKDAGLAVYDPSKEGLSLWWKQDIETMYQKDALGNDILDAYGDKVPLKDSEGNVVTKYHGNVMTTNYSDASEYVTSAKLTPALYGGFNTRLDAYGFDLYVNFAYQIGGKVIDSDYASFMGSPTSSSKGSNFHADILNAWSQDNQDSNIPRFQFQDTYTNGTSTRFLTKASYLSLQNITLGYTLPAALTKKAKLEKVRIYANANNVFLWSKRQGLDPRVAMYNGGSGTSSYYSPIRTISGGVNIVF